MTAAKREYVELFQRHHRNPILTAANWPYPANSVFNPAATRLPDGTTLLLCRVEDHRGHSHLTAARSQNGVDGWVVDPEPTLGPDLQAHPEEIWGLEDPRITYAEELEAYVIAYTTYSRGGPCVSLAMTKDFDIFQRWGVVMPPEDKDAALLPQRIDGRWALIHRPVTTLGQHIWVSYSPDLHHWGGHEAMMYSRRGAWWDSDKIGLAAPPIQTPEGWLMIYHGVRRRTVGPVYRLGLALFDLHDLGRCLLRGDTWVFGPRELYEREGDVPNVVFPTGYTIEPDGDTINIYYGAADTSVALATGSLRRMLDWLREHGREDIRIHE